MRKIKMQITSAKAGHSTVEYNGVGEAMAGAREELQRGRWVYGNSEEGGLQLLTEDDINEERFGTLTELFSQPTLEGG